ncbi:Ohr family peroxiredoxin [Ramlibacter sp. AN1015]|uniref:Ohr family peroxiredoxin n=1 Tax=Ramlibacter sp. AN1015 TaxID=3133428 RepID=UPI0030C15F79
MDPLYRARATCAGPHPGEVRSSDGVLRARLGVPHELGGTGGGTNPEQLLAAAYAACFYTALEQAAREAGQPLPADLQVDCDVGLGRRDDGFALELQVHVAQADEAMREWVERAAQLWPHAPGVEPVVRVTGVQGPG